jgi:hypothetical protein
LANKKIKKRTLVLIAILVILIIINIWFFVISGELPPFTRLLEAQI